MIRRLPWNQHSGWHYSVDTSIGLNFCIWVLRTDGLKGPPFDRHPDGNGSLRDAGLDVEGWKNWWRATFDGHLEFHDAIRAHQPPSRDFAISHYFSYRLWDGDNRVADPLRRAWEVYEPLANIWKQRYAESRHFAGKPADQRKLWRRLEPYRAVLAPPRLYIVEYPETVIEPFGSSAAVIGTAVNRLDPQRCREIVFQAVASLANQRTE